MTRSIPRDPLFGMVLRLAGLPCRTARARIQQNEEITVSYIGETYADHFTRTSFLLSNFGFNCTCPACTESPDTLATDDKIRNDIFYLIDVARHKPPVIGLNMAERTLRLMSKAGLDTALDRANVHAAARQYALAAGNLPKAKEHLDLCIKCYRQTNGDAPFIANLLTERISLGP